MKKDYKSGFVTLIGRPNVGKINSDEPVDRTEDCDHIEQTTDDT